MKEFLIKNLINFVPSSKKRKELRNRLLNKNSKQLQFKNELEEKHSYCGAFFVSPNVTVGKYCSIASGCILGTDFHPTDWVTTSPRLLGGKGKFNRFSKIEIGNDVWIGVNTIVIANKDIKIGTGAIIAAGAVITHNVPPYSIVAGVPAKIIRYRYSDEIIKKLLESNWWNIDYEKLKQMNLKDVNQFLKQVKEYKNA